MLSIRTPSSIFVRIYGGLLLVISMVALSTYLLIQVVNDHRAAEYRESMATDVRALYLCAEEMHHRRD